MGLPGLTAELLRDPNPLAATSMQLGAGRAGAGRPVMQAELMRDANTLAATSMQLGAGLAVAAATVALRAGPAVTGGGQAAYTLAFCLLALIAVGCAVEAVRLDPRAGDAARGLRQAP